MPSLLLDSTSTVAARKPACSGGGGGKKNNLETCTEALGCETGGVDGCDGGVEAEDAESKRRAGEEEEEEMVTEGSVCQLARRRGRGPLPPPLKMLAPGTNRVRMVHERRDGRLEVYAVRSPGILEAKRSEGRLRLRLHDAATCCQRLEPEEEYGFAKYLRGGGRCADPEGGTTAAKLGKQWEPEQAAAFWVATA